MIVLGLSTPFVHFAGKKRTATDATAFPAMRTSFPELVTEREA
jgi:hypothetical protein